MNSTARMTTQQQAPLTSTTSRSRRLAATTATATTMRSRQPVRSRRDTFLSTRAAWAAGIVFSLSAVATAAFQPNLAAARVASSSPGSTQQGQPTTTTTTPLSSSWRSQSHDPPGQGRESKKLLPLAAVTDPEVLLGRYSDSSDDDDDDNGWTDAHRKRLELLYALATAERRLELAEASAAAAPPSRLPKRVKRTVAIKRKGPKKTVSIPQGKLDRPATTYKSSRDGENQADKVQFRLSTTKKGRARKVGARASVKSSTMPGFAAESGRQLAYRESVRQYEQNTGRKYVEDASADKKRRKVNGETMYRNSASVPDSMLQFAGDIHQEERITRQEEKELGTKTQEAIRLQQLYENLEQRLDREPTDQEWCAAAGKINMEAIRQTIEEGLEAKNKLVTSNLRLVQSVVNTYIRNGLSAQYNAGDMMQEGILALIRAAEKFEPDRGWKFSTYAMYWVRASVKRNQVAQSRVINVPHRLYENHKRIMRIERELTLALDRKPTLKEVAEASQLPEHTVLRSITAQKQRCISFDQEMRNGHKPNSENGRGSALVEILDGKSEDSDDKALQERLLREDLMEKLHRHLTPDEVELLLLRYGIKQIPGLSTRRIGGQPTIAELSCALGLKPDKVRRMINKSLAQLPQLGGVIVCFIGLRKHPEESHVQLCKHSAALAESMEGFDDLEDEDHHGDDEDYRFTWNWEDCVDEGDW